MVYKFKQDSGFSGDAESVCNELERVREQNNGQLRPIHVVGAARDEENPLHPYFEWNDAVAAEEHRKSTARKLVRSVVIVPEKNESKRTTAQPVFINVRNNKDQYYQSIEAASVDEFESAIEDFKRRLNQLKNSLDHVERAAQTAHQKEKAFNLKRKTEELESTT